MAHTHTHTMATVAVSVAAYDEILRALGSDAERHARTLDGGVIDMSGLGIVIEKEEEESQANQRQVGGSHYSGYPLQHWDLVSIFNWDYFQGQITKYIMRWKKKNGVQDLEKAAHFLEKYIEVEKTKSVKQKDGAE